MQVSKYVMFLICRKKIGREDSEHKKRKKDVRVVSSVTRLVNAISGIMLAILQETGTLYLCALHVCVFLWGLFVFRFF